MKEKVWKFNLNYVVVAEDPTDALFFLAANYDVKGEWITPFFETKYVEEVTKEEDLPDGWDSETPLFTQSPNDENYTFADHLKKIEASNCEPQTLSLDVVYPETVVINGNIYKLQD